MREVLWGKITKQTPLNNLSVGAEIKARMWGGSYLFHHFIFYSLTLRRGEGLFVVISGGYHDLDFTDSGA